MVFTGGQAEMTTHNAALELLERELAQCTQRARELRRAINVLNEAGGALAVHGADAPSRTPEGRMGRIRTRDIALQILREHEEGMTSVQLYDEVIRRGGAVKNPNSLNNILNRHSDRFARHPASQRTWILTQSYLDKHPSPE